MYMLVRPTVERGGGGVATLVVHGCDEAPLVGLGRVSLGRVLTHVAVVAAHRVDTTVQHRYAHVAPVHQHARTVKRRHRIYRHDTVAILWVWHGILS